MSVWFSSRWFLHFRTLKYYTWNTKVFWWKSTYRLTDVRGIFLDISNAFDKVWQKRLIYKFKSHGISGNLLKPIENYLTDRTQRVVLDDQTSSWERALSGVSQRSVLWPLIFFIYINELRDGIQSISKIFADNMSWFSKCHNFKKSERVLHEDLITIK